MSSDQYEGLVRTELRFADGIWTMTSCDLPGLLLAHDDIEAVLDDAPDAIKLLFELNYSMKLSRVVPVQPAADLGHGSGPRHFTPPSGYTAIRLAA